MKTENDQKPDKQILSDSAEVSEISESVEKSSITKNTNAQTNVNIMVEIGNKLKRAREEKGISESEIIAQIKISHTYLKAIESGHWEIIPSPIYTRAFVNDYARALKLDLSSEFPKNEFSLKVKDKPINNSTDFSSKQKLLSTGFNRNKNNYMLMFAVALIAIFIGFGILYFDKNNFLISSDKVTNTTNINVQPSQTENINNSTNVLQVPTIANLAQIIPQNIPQNLSQALPSTNLKPIAQDLVITKVEDVKTNNLPNENDENFLAITTTESSWVQISRSSGAVISEFLLTKDKSFSQKIIPPFNLIVGNARSVTIMFSGKEINIDKNLTVNGNARLFVK